MGGPRLAATVLVLLAATASLAAADLSKLDPRARVALERARGAGGPQTVPEGAALAPGGELDVFIRGAASRAALEAAGARVRTVAGDLATAYVPAAAVERVAALPGVTSIRGAAPLELELSSSVAACGAAALRGPGPTFTGLSGEGVLVGAVDSGVDWGHGDFHRDGHSRIVAIWDQTGVGTPPASLPYGAEWPRATLRAGGSDQVDVVGHGTHVLSIAAGDGSHSGGAVPQFTYAGMAPRADLAMVKTNFTNTGILDGVRYLFDLAAARRQDAVVNLSLGSHYGPHDGTSDVEAGITALTGPGRIVVKSAGNDRGAARHAEVFAAGSGSPITLSVSGSAAGRAIQLDGYYEASENVSVRITTPGGTVIGPVTRGNRHAAFPGVATSNGSIYLENGVSRTATGDHQVYIEINAASGQSMNGTWTITMIPVALAAARGQVDLWRFYSSTGVTANFVTGNQATEELLTEPGNAHGVITVAAYVTRRDWVNCAGQTTSFPQSGAVGSLAWFSSPGPTRDLRQKPDIAAPGAAIAGAMTMDVTQTCASGSPLLPDGPTHVMMAGTSMASAHVAGAVALLLQAFGSLTPAEVKSLLTTNALRDGATGASWNKEWGNGKLRLAANLLPAPAEVPPQRLEIRAVAPNPARGQATIAFAVPRAGPVRVAVADLQGRRVALLADRTFGPGRHELRWNGRTAAGPAPAGIYFVVVEAAGERATRRLALSR